ncbi:oxidoreductase [Aureococcus anophagefferens]|nr:oxidoreductase [Aureococcus anophagefferens]
MMMRSQALRALAKRALSTATATASSTPHLTSSKLLHGRELQFLLHEFIDLQALLATERFRDHDVETIESIVEAGSTLAEEVFYDANPVGDREAPTYDADADAVVHPAAVVDAQKQYAEGGFIGMTLEQNKGGLGLPVCAAALANLPFSVANTGLMSYHGVTNGSITLLAAHGSPEQQATWLPKLTSGEAYGTMCLSESHAGSSLTDLRTSAAPNGDGSYAIKGNKMWITGGDQGLSENIVHFVLAKLPGAPPGVKGISLFLVPKVLESGARNDVYLGGMNHKMGQIASVNAGELLFGDRTGAATGYLVGEPHEGLKCMFVMMNELRVGVGMGAAASGVAGYTAALRYARDRAQGRPLTSKDPAAPMVPIVQHADVKRMLLAARAYFEGGVALSLYGAELIDKMAVCEDAAAKHELHLVLELLIPMIKSWPSEWGLEANRLAIQIHGGAGYTTDFIVEQLYRDARVNSIYEGTTGIQSLDLLGRKLRPAAAALGAALETFGKTTEKLVGVAAAGDVDTFLANSNEYLTAAGHLVVAWMWLKQGTIASAALEAGAGDDDAFYRKLHAHNVDMKDEWFY